MSITPATLSSLASTLIDRTSGTLNGTATVKPYPPLVPVTCNALSRTVPFESPHLEVWVSGPAKTVLGKRLILCMILLVETVEHILRDQFHGRRELAGQDCDLLVECADLLRKLVDDGVRVGWNLSQNKSPFNAKPPQSDWIAGAEKWVKRRGQSAAVIVSMRVTALSSSSVKVRPRFVLTSVTLTDVPESSNVASTPR